MTQKTKRKKRDNDKMNGTFKAGLFMAIGGLIIMMTGFSLKGEGIRWKDVLESVGAFLTVISFYFLNRGLNIQDEN